MRLLACAVLAVGCQTSTERVPAPAVVAREECASSVLREIVAKPGWKLLIEDKKWSDVRGPDDPIVQSVELDDHAATWRSGDLPQQLELDPSERTQLLAAIVRSCEPMDAGNGFGGHYVLISRGPLALRIPSESPAAIETRNVLDGIRARYVAKRLPLARTMTLTLTGPYRTGEHDFEPRTLVLQPDGTLVFTPHRADGDELSPSDHVDALDFVTHLPQTEQGSGAFTGTLAIGGTARPIAILPALHIFSIDVDPLRRALASWWRIDHPVPDRP